MIKNAIRLLIIFLCLLPFQNVYCQDFRNVIAEIEKVIKNEFIAPNFLYYVESNQKCYTGYRFWGPKVELFKKSFTKLPEQFKDEVVDYDENIYTQIIVFLHYAVVQNNSKSPKANKNGCFKNESDALKAVSEPDFNDGSGKLNANQILLCFGYDKAINTVKLLTPKRDTLSYKILNAKNITGENYFDKIKFLKVN